MSNRLFNIAALVVGFASAGLFILIAVLGKVYVYEGNVFILAVEIILSSAFAVWATIRFWRMK